MRLEALCLRDELEPGPRHRLVVLAGNSGLGGDVPDPLREAGERLLLGVAALETTGNAKVTLVGEGRALDSTGFEIIQQEITIWCHTI